MNTTSQHFPRDTEGLPAARSSEIVELADGDAIDLRIAPVAKRLGDATVRMLVYNGSVPGPVLKVPQGAEVVVARRMPGCRATTIGLVGVRRR